MTTMKSQVIIKTGLLLVILLAFQVSAEQISDFKSDGCSHFPDGTLEHKNLWCDCCIAHDIAYWQGGTRLQKKVADQALRDCVVNKTGNQLLADTMYIGVTVGGLPVYPIWYRWGFGWPYGRGFQVLSTSEKTQVQHKLQAYKNAGADLNCNFEYPLFHELKQGLDSLKLK